MQNLVRNIKLKKWFLSPNQDFQQFDIGTNVVIRVPDLDRRRLAPRNILAFVVDVSSSGLYLMGTKEGLLERLYARNEFTATDNNFIVPSSSPYLRSASMITSRSKQGSVSCHFKRYCIDKKRKCHLKNVKCKSKCHSNSSCKNKWAPPLFFIRPTLHVFFYQ